MTTEIIRINEWNIDLLTGEMYRAGAGAGQVEAARLDPLCVQLLRVLAEHEGELVSKAFLIEALWPETYVNEDALARYVSRLRKAIGDTPKNPLFIETLPKRGYRLVANSVSRVAPDSEPAPASGSESEPEPEASEPPTPSASRTSPVSFYVFGIIALITALIIGVYAVNDEMSQGSPDQVDGLLAQADVYYHQVTRKDNEMALSLYQQTLALNPDSASALSGMANALVQKAIRYSPDNDPAQWRAMSLKQALQDNRLSRDQARQFLSRALVFAEKAVAMAPDNARTHKAKGFVLSARGNLNDALTSYKTALSINPGAWDVLVNMGELHELLNLPLDAIAYYKQAFAAMGQFPFEQASHGRAWRAEMGVNIGNKYLELNNLNDAEIWFRHVLSFAPFHTRATQQLANILVTTNRENESQRLCSAYTERIGEPACI
ncbi:winged helix-turn-helix domain-containing protein [Alteromonas gilva]|uniref:Winged helix-turn-helix domain-containing protein n=1 Tax=Alteromonas gilva TaxID=2987522 RepID=A0ABT5L4M3_9ALTE|nr:winged helix-turn-helix domain-containing protein [Alteromonas gilva]MDC8831991.1 winged helix-turn-helix domain-containing protein [Alteromonas gilva]